jgi:PST family polysaccharide transporter
MMATASPQDLRLRAVGAFLWAHGSYISGKLLVFAATLVLARLLVPADFGTVAFVLAVLGFMEGLKDLGLGAALVYREDATEDRIASTAFWMGIVGSGVLVGLSWLLAPHLAGIAGDPQVTSVMRVLSLNFLIVALGSTHVYLLKRSLEFRSLFGREVLAGLVKGGVSVVLALSGLGVWSLVIGQLAGSASRTLMVWWITKWQPRLTIARDQLRSMLRFGTSLSGLGVLGEIGRNIDYFVIGALLGPTQVGYYLMAFRFVELALVSVFQSLWDVLFPFYARLRESQHEGVDDRVLVEGYLKSLRFGSVLAFTLGGSIAGLALPIVLVLFGETWRPAATPLALIAIWGSLVAVAGMAGTVYKSIGRPGLLAMQTVFWVALVVPGVWIGAHYGITAVALAHVVTEAALLVVVLVVSARILAFPWTQAFVNLWPAVAVAVPVTGALVGLTFSLAPVPALAAGVPVGILLALGILRLGFSTEYRTAVGVLKALRPDRAHRELTADVPSAQAGA